MYASLCSGMIESSAGFPVFDKLWKNVDSSSGDGTEDCLGCLHSDFPCIIFFLLVLGDEKSMSEIGAYVTFCMLGGSQAQS